MTTRQKRAARDLVDKLERLAEDAEALQSKAAAMHNLTEHARLVERATNYAHAATLARNLLDVDP